MFRLLTRVTRDDAISTDDVRGLPARSLLQEAANLRIACEADGEFVRTARLGVPVRPCKELRTQALAVGVRAAALMRAARAARATVFPLNSSLGRSCRRSSASARATTPFASRERAMVLATSSSGRRTPPLRSPAFPSTT